MMATRRRSRKFEKGSKPSTRRGNGCIAVERRTAIREGVGARLNQTDLDFARLPEPNPLAETALHCAARDPSDPDWPNPMLEAILSTPGHVFALGPGGRTALHEARGAPNILALLRAGADPDARGAKAIDAVMALPEGPRAWSLYERGLLEARAPAARSEGRRRL